MGISGKYLTATGYHEDTVQEGVLMRDNYIQLARDDIDRAENAETIHERAAYLFRARVTLELAEGKPDE